MCLFSLGVLVEQNKTFEDVSISLGSEGDMHFSIFCGNLYWNLLNVHLKKI